MNSDLNQNPASAPAASAPTSIPAAPKTPNVTPSAQPNKPAQGRPFNKKQRGGAPAASPSMTVKS